MKNQKALVIQLTRDESRIALMKTNATAPSLLNSVVLPTPEGAIEDGVIRDFEAMRELINSAIQTLKCKNVRRTIFVMCTSRITSETVTVPKAPQKQLGKILSANMDIYFPVEMDQYHMSWQILREVQGENDQAELEVKLWAVSKEVLTGYYALANACGLYVAAVDYCGHSQASVVGAYYTDRKKENDSFFTLSLTSKKEKPAKKKTEKEEEENEQFEMDIIQIDTPEMELHLSVMKEFILTTILLGKCVQMQRMTPYSNAYEVASDISMTLEYYLSEHPDLDAPEYVCITSCDEMDVLLEEELQAALDTPVKYLFEEEELPWALCKGAAQTQLDFGSITMNSKKHTVSPLMNVDVEKLFLIASCAVVVGAGVLTVASSGKWKEVLAELEERRITLASENTIYYGAADEYNAYATAYDSYSQDWETIFSSIRTYNDNLNLVLKELENVLPKDVSVTQLGINAEGISVQLASESKKTLAYTIMAMRELQYSSLDSISNVTGGTAPAAQAPVATTPSSSSETEETSGEEAAPTTGSSVSARTSDIFQGLKDNLSKKDAKALYEELALSNSTKGLENRYGADKGSGKINGNPNDDQRIKAMENLFYNNPFAVNDILNGLSTDKRAEITDAATLYRYLELYLGQMKDLGVGLAEVYMKDQFVNVYNWYVYYLNNPTTCTESLFYLSESAVTKACKNGSWPSTGDDKINKILETYLPYDGETTDTPDKDDPSTDNPSTPPTPSLPSTPSTDGDSVTISQKLWEVIMDKAGLGDYGLEAPESIPKNVYDDMQKWYLQSGGGTKDVALPESVYDWFIQQYGAELFPDGTGDGSGGIFGEEDGRFVITLELSYKEELIQAELQRKGLFYSNKLLKLEVE